MSSRNSLSNAAMIDVDSTDCVRQPKMNERFVCVLAVVLSPKNHLQMSKFVQLLTKSICTSWSIICILDWYDFVLMGFVSFCTPVYGLELSNELFSLSMTSKCSSLCTFYLFFLWFIKLSLLYGVIQIAIRKFIRKCITEQK